MKRYALFVIMNLCVSSLLQAQIINGYESKIGIARNGLKNLTVILATDRSLSFDERRRIKKFIEEHRKFILYHEITARLLSEFEIIEPEIYNAINSITDAKNRPVTVYVKFIPIEKTKGRLIGCTNVPIGQDDDAYHSEYGWNTAAVTIGTVKDALSYLAHEFGHLLYQIPNIAEYGQYYKTHYMDKEIGAEVIGHHHTDISGRKAMELERRFRKVYAIRRRTNQ